jgi:hypothetical protein
MFSFLPMRLGRGLPTMHRDDGDGPSLKILLVAWL